MLNKVWDGICSDDVWKGIWYHPRFKMDELRIHAGIKVILVSNWPPCFIEMHCFRDPEMHDQVTFKFGVKA